MKKTYTNLVKKTKIGLLSLTSIFTLFLGTLQTNAQILLTESFDGATFVPTGWTDVLTSGSNTWTRVTTGSTGFPSVTVLPNSGAGEAFFNAYSASGGVRSLMTPVLNFTTSGTKQVSFWMYRDAGYSTTADKIDVLINTVNNLTGATLLGTVNRANGLAPVVTANGWYKYTFTVPNSFNTATNYVFFRGTSAYGNNIFIDDVTISNMYAAASNNCSFDYISNVTVSTINRSSACDTYSLWATPNPTLTQGSTYTLSITTAGDMEGIRAWIDYNGDGSFNNAVGTELVAGPSYAGTVPATYVVAVTIPGSATPGLTRLRVRCNYATSPVDATSSQTYGETEDYNVTIAAATSCVGAPNAGIAAITSSVGCPGNAITLSATGLTSASGITSQWQSSSLSTGPWANITGATSSSYATSTTTTTYYRVISTCTTSALSATSSVVSYSVVNPGPCVCNAYPLNYASSTVDEEITNVTVGPMNNSSTCSLVAGGAGSILNRYGNYSGIVAGPSVSQASSVSFSLTQTSCGGAYDNFFQIYVDWNQDGDWLDAGEQVYSQAASVNGNQTVTGSFMVPITATLGTTRMRIVNIEDVASTTNYAHNIYSWGETEDYCMTITAAVGCTGTPNTGTTSISSSAGCSGSTINLTTSGLTSGAAIAYQWSSASNAAGPWTNIIGATATTYSFTSAVGTSYYRLVTTCANSATSNTTNVVSFTGVNCISTNVPATGSNTINCGTSTKLYDDGGATGVYGNSWNGFTVLNNTGPGVINISGSFTYIETNWDYLKIYAGAGTGGTLLYSYTNSSGGTITPFSSAPGQIITVQFTSDGSGVGDGFNMDVVYTNYVAPTPTITIAGTPLICAGATTSLTASGATTYTWSGLGSTNPLSVTPSAATIYSVTGSACGVNSSPVTYTVVVNASPSITVNSGTVCSGSSFTLTPTGGTTYTYTGGSAVVSPTTNTSYTVTSANVSGCIGSAISSITVNASPSITVNSGTICSGSSYTMTPTGGTTYIYTSGSAVVSPTTNTSYTVTSSNASGCIGSAISTVTVNARPIVSLLTGGTICSGTSYTMVASGATTYTYSSGSAIVSPTTTTTYSVIGRSAAGCLSSNTATTTVVVSASPSITVNSGAICSGSSYTLTPTGGSTYTYTGGSAVVSPTANTSYTVTSANVSGCIGSAISSITVNASPSITVNSGTICSGSSYTMTPTGGTTYTYSGGSAIVSPTSNTSFTVTSSNASGCIGSAISNVTVNSNAAVSALASNSLICVGNSAVLTASTSATSYTWNTGATTMSISVSPTVTTTYTVNVTDVTSCSSSAVVTVNVSACTGIDELIANTITIYPNPNNGIINITLSSKLSKNSTLEIYDAIGKLIITEVLSNELNTLNISNLSNGIYSFRVLNNNSMIKFGKFIKQ